MRSRTKIIATLGPSCEDPKVLEDMIQAGMNIARLNASHGTYEQLTRLTQNVRTAAQKLHRRVSVMLDLQGPKIRLGTLPEAGIPVSAHQEILFSCDEQTDGILIAGAPHLPKWLKVGDRILIEDGMITTKVIAVDGARIRAITQNPGTLRSHKGVNLPDTHWDPQHALTEKDLADLKFGLQTLQVDAVALSFVENAELMKSTRHTIQTWCHRPVVLIAKIERPQALTNLESILKVSDGIMVARGDLAIETTLEAVPIYQKQMVERARAQGKAVIVATQMLQSMVTAPLPTRAEVSDVAEAVFEMADAVMLSNETAVGNYPVEAVTALHKIAISMENHIFKTQELYPIALPKARGRAQADQSMALNACRLADELNAEALVVLTKHGYSAFSTVKHRPKNKLIVVTPHESTAQHLNFYWGLHETYVQPNPAHSEEVVQNLKKDAILQGRHDVVVLKLSKKKRSLVLLSPDR